MAKLLETWLNSEVELSKKVTDFEEDFSNGYLLGELLYKFNQQSDFQEFKDRHSRSIVLNNFTRMIEVFKGLNVSFETHVINDIIKKTPGTAIKLIYQLKMALEKTSPPVDIKLVKQGKVAEQPPVKCIRPPRPQFDEMERKNIETRLQTLNKSQKEIDLEEKMKKFALYQKAAEGKSAKVRFEEDLIEKQKKEEKRKASINKLQRNAGFMEDWEQKGVQDWKKNIEIKKKREQMELKYNLKVVEKVKIKADTFYSKTRTDAMANIEDFEQTLKSFGIPVKPYKETASKTMSAFPLFTSTIGASQQRDIKRRTMAVKLNMLETQKEAEYRHVQALKKLDVLSTLEENVANDIWRVTHYTELFIAQRKLREMRYDRRREYDNEISQLKEQKVLERWIDNTWLEVELEDARSENMLKSIAGASTNCIGNDIAGIVDLIVEMTEEVFSFQQDKDSENIDDRFMADWLQLFKTGSPISSGTSDELAQKEFKDYLYAKGQWTGEAKFNLKFGEILLTIIDTYLREAPEEKEKNKILEFPIKLAFLGYPYSGKTCHAGRVKNRFDVEVIEIKDLIQFVDKESALAGGVVSDNELVRVVVERIKMCTGCGWVLVDFPKTLKQCELLEKELNGYLHPLHKGKSVKQQKISEISMAFPSDRVVSVPINYSKSSMDHFILLNCDKYECLRRCFGRRIDPVTGMVYQVEDDQPSFNESPLIERLLPEDNFNEHRGCISNRIVNFEAHKGELKEWLQNFQTFSQPCLIEINSNRPILEVGQEIEKIVDVLLEKHQKAKAEEKDKELEILEKNKLKEVSATEKKSRKRESLLMLEEDDKETVLTGEIEEDVIIAKKERVEGMWDYWDCVFQGYKKVFFTVFSQEKALRTQFMRTLKSQQLDFIGFLDRPSEKQELVIQFHQNFNIFSDENPDMREDPATINELHLRIEDLCNSLWDIIERRQHEAEEELKEITKSGQVEGHIDIITGHFQLLISAEYHKYVAACQIIADFYASLEQKKLYKPEVPAIEFVLEGANPTEMIDKLCEKVLALPPVALTAEEEKDSKDPKNKKKDVKGSKKEEEKLERTEIEYEMDDCLKKELELLVSRIDRLRVWSKGKIKEIEQESSKVYHRMEKWISASIHAENKAIEVISAIVREAIEDKSKIQKLLELKSLDLVLNEKVLYYEILPIPPPPPNISINYTKLWNFTDSEIQVSKRPSAREMTHRRVNS